MDAAEIAAEVARASTLTELEALRVRLLGKKGEITGVLKQLVGAAPEQRAAFGQKVNALKAEAQQRLDARKGQLESQAEDATLAAGWVDVTAPHAGHRPGHRHPLTLVLEEVIEHFTGL